MNRVVITGIGTNTPIGNNVEKTWKSIICGTSKFCYYSKLGVNISRLDKDYNIGLPKRDIRYQDKTSQLACLAATEAIQDSKLNESDLNNSAIGVGTAIGGINTTVEQVIKACENSKLSSIAVRTIIKMLPNMIASNLSIKFNIKGPSLTYCSACSSSSISLGELFKKLRYGETSTALIVGTEACLNDEAIMAFKKLGVLSTSDNLSEASLPFMKGRTGFVMSEGATAMVIETLDHAKKRNADIYAEIVGYGNCSDAVSLVAPSESGMEKAMDIALKDANLTNDKIAYINAHGTATTANDKFESEAISKLFPKKTKVSSTKAVSGHLLGAAGLFEAMLCAKMLQNNFYIKQFGINSGLIDANTKFQEMLLKENYTASPDNNQTYVMSNSFAFGGVNCSLIFKKWIDKTTI